MRHPVEFDELSVIGDIEDKPAFYLNRSTEILETVIVHHKIGDIKGYLYISSQIYEIYLCLEGGTSAESESDDAGQYRKVGGFYCFLKGPSINLHSPVVLLVYEDCYFTIFYLQTATITYGIFFLLFSPVGLHFQIRNSFSSQRIVSMIPPSLLFRNSPISIIYRLIFSVY